MRKSYEVSGHVFELIMPDVHPLWGMMSQYYPFEVPAGRTAVFVLELSTSLPDLEKKLVYDETPEDQDQSRIGLYRTQGGWHFDMYPTGRSGIACRMQANEDFTHAVFCPRPERNSALYGLNNSLMLLFAFATATMDTLEMHASVVMKDGMGYLFLGKSGTGKSTHSRQWLEHIPGTSLLNDDNPVVRVGEDGAVCVHGSPWSGKTPCYKKLDVPVRAMVLIRQSPENSIRRMSVVQAYATLYSSSSGFKHDERQADGLYAAMEKVVSSVPFYILDCRPDYEAADVCFETVGLK